MDDTTEAIVSKLKSLKQQGLTYYQANQQLLQSGYTQVQIQEAADQFNYTASPNNNNGYADLAKQSTLTTQTPASPPIGSELDRSYEKLGNAVIADKERDKRPFVYIAIVPPTAGFAMQAYRLWLTTMFWDGGHNKKYLFVYNFGSYLLAGVIGGGLAIVGLKLYFHAKDKRYKRIDTDPPKGSDS